MQGNPAQIWGEQGAEGARAAPLAAKAAHNTLASLPLFLTATRQLNALITIDTLVPGSPELILLGDWATGRLALEKWPALPAGVSWTAHLWWVLGWWVMADGVGGDCEGKGGGGLSGLASLMEVTLGM